MFKQCRPRSEGSGKSHLICVWAWKCSYKFVKCFLEITFFILCYFQLKLAWYVSTFFMSSETKFQLDPTIMRNFSIETHSKNRSVDMTLPMWAIFPMGVYWEIICRIQLKFRSCLHKERWHISCKFQLEIAKNKQAFDKLIWNEQ